MFPKQNQSKAIKITLEVSTSRPYSPDKTAASQNITQVKGTVSPLTTGWADPAQAASPETHTKSAIITRQSNAANV